MMRFLRLIGDSRGATAIEYGLIAALVAVAAIPAVKFVGTRVGVTFNKAANNMPA